MIDLRELAESRGLRLSHRAGRNWRGPCPICKTSGNSQSLAIAAEVWNCHACGEKGGILAFYRQVLGEEPPKNLFAPIPNSSRDERKRIEARNLDVIGCKVATARLLDAVRKRLRELGPDQLEEVWELREIEEIAEGAADRTAGLDPRTLRLYLDKLEGRI